MKKKYYIGLHGGKWNSAAIIKKKREQKENAFKTLYFCIARPSIDISET